jgi:hypothetical protein
MSEREKKLSTFLSFQTRLRQAQGDIEFHTFKFD